MKKIFTCLITFLFTVSLAACTVPLPEIFSGRKSSETPRYDFSAVTEENPDNIQLQYLSLNFFTFGDPSYRLVYYSLPEYVLSLVWEIIVSNEPWLRFLGSFSQYNISGPDEMYIVKLVKEYNIPKSEFVKAMEMEKNRLHARGFDIFSEEFELPNADIIYTFDNDLINTYYKRGKQPKNPYKGTIPGQLPSYVPGSIVPVPDMGEIEPYTFYEWFQRDLYYTIPEYVSDLVPKEQYSRWEHSHYAQLYPGIINEMQIASFIKFTGIEKDVFVRATDQHRTLHENEPSPFVDGIKLIHTDSGEIPNADIIYTFDNGIINNYYRRDQ